MISTLKRYDWINTVGKRSHTITQNTSGQVPPISLDHCQDVSTPGLDPIYGKLNWLDLIWKGTHLSKRPHNCQCISEQKPSFEVKGSACRAQETRLLQDIEMGKARKKYVALRVHNSTVASIILKFWRYCVEIRQSTRRTTTNAALHWSGFYGYRGGRLAFMWTFLWTPRGVCLSKSCPINLTQVKTIKV